MSEPDSINPSPDLQGEVQAQHEKVCITAISSKTSDYQRTRHPDAQWYSQASLGLFFHWGISSVSGQGDLSWGMMKRERGHAAKAAAQYGIYAAQTGMTPDAYWKQAEKFLCEEYDPNKWLSAAREAGVEYVVLTTKHHDGFCLWPSEYGALSTKNYLRGRDLVGEFVAACRKNGLKIGFYYSPPDWHFHRRWMSFEYGNDQPGLDIHWKPYKAAQKAAREEAYREHCDGHVRELLTRYGKIDIIWFDGAMPPGAMSMEEIRQMQPGILINPRGYGVGDFDTPECKFPDSRLEEGWWELCYVFSDGAWGYLDHEVYKPLGWLLEEWTKTRAWGGKFLPNVAPDSHGRMPDGYYLRMRQLKEWMTHSGESLKDASAGEWPEKSNVPLTRKKGKIYAHVGWIFDLEEKVEITCLREKPASVRLLRTGDPVPYTYESGSLTLTIPVEWRTNKSDVVVIE